MLRRIRPKGVHGAVAAALLAIACNREAVPPLNRLLPALGEPNFERLGGGRSNERGLPTKTLLNTWTLESRPALGLRPGQTVSCEVPVGRGARLVFSYGPLEDAPRRGYIRLRARVNGREVWAGQVFVQRRDRWRTAAVSLNGSGRARIEFQAEHLDGNGNVVSASEASASAWIGLGSPRLEAPADLANRRILVWISQDTVRADHLGAYGYARRTSPAFDALSREWVTFENGVATASWTLPSMTSQFTSRYPIFHGAVLETEARDARHPTVFEVLARAGFTVLGVSGNAFVSQDFGLAGGFDALWFSGGAAEAVNRLVLRALEEWGGGDLALFVHYQDPHSPYQPPAPYHELFDPQHGDQPADRNPAHVTRNVALYDGEIAYTDRQIAALIDTLRQRGLLERAVIVYAADHGEEFLDHGGWAHGRTLYQEMLHVPFAIRVPRARPARVSQVVSLVDLAPTVLAALGIEAPATFQGRNLLPLLAGKTVPEQPVYAETERNDSRNHLVAVRHGGLKYVLTARAGRVAPPEVIGEEMFDLVADPREENPLGASPARERLRRAAEDYLRRGWNQSPASSPAQLTPEVTERLRALGYIR